MTFDNARRSPSLPKSWPMRVKSSVLTVIALAHYTITYARGWAANSLNARVRQSAEIDQLRSEIDMLHEELRIKDTRMAAIMPHRRPHYAPMLRMAILELKAARGWSLAQAAGAFLIEPATLAAWIERIDESGPTALVQLPQPVNKFPDFVRYIIQRLKAVCPTMGKVKIAQTLARAGLHLGTTTVGRMLKGELTKMPDKSIASSDNSKHTRIVTAKRPNHVWHIDLTVVPTGGGFWTTWLPFSLPQRWPFCWWVACVIDHFSRRVMDIAVFNKQPDGQQVRKFMAKTIRKNEAKPDYIICDKGVQFWCRSFKSWCRRRKIKPRFGAIGQHGSIAVIERFIRTMKDECFRRLVIPLGRKEFLSRAQNYVVWYNCHRPHIAIGGRTPEERYRRIPSACRKPRFEPRPRWPETSGCASPSAKVRGRPGARLELVITWHDNQKYLPIVSLKRVA